MLFPENSFYMLLFTIHVHLFQILWNVWLDTTRNLVGLLANFVTLGTLALPDQTLRRLHQVCASHCHDHVIKIINIAIALPSVRLIKIAVVFIVIIGRNNNTSVITAIVSNHSRHFISLTRPYHVVFDISEVSF